MREKHLPSKVVEVIIALAPYKEQEIMTAARRLEIKSEKKGRQQEKLPIARNMLSKSPFESKNSQGSHGSK